MCFGCFFRTHKSFTIKEAGLARAVLVRQKKEVGCLILKLYGHGIEGHQFNRLFLIVCVLSGSYHNIKIKRK